MRGLLLAATVAALLGGCNVKTAESDPAKVAGASADAVKGTDAEQAVAAAHAAYVGGDAQKIMDLYAPGAIVFDPAHREPSNDRAMQTRWAADFVLMKPADMVSKPVIQPLGPDSFIASGIAAFTAQVNGNRSLLHSRYSQVFQRQPDGRWLIVHEHMSIPPAENEAM